MRSSYSLQYQYRRTVVVEVTVRYSPASVQTAELSRMMKNIYKMRRERRERGKANPDLILMVVFFVNHIILAICNVKAATCRFISLNYLCL